MTHVSIAELMDLNNTFDLGNWEEDGDQNFKPIWQEEWLYLNRSREIKKTIYSRQV